MGHLRAGQQAVRRAGRRGRRRGRDRLGARLPAAAGAGAAAPAAGPTSPSASSCTSRSRPTSCSPSCPGGRRSSRACSAPTWSASSGRPRRANFVQLARRLHDLPARGHDGRVRRPHGGRPGLPDLHRRRARSTSWPAPPRCWPGRRRSARSWATRRRSSWASTGWTTPRASASGWRRSRSCSRTAPSRRRTPSSCRWPRPSRERVEHYVHMRETIEQQVGHINGVFGSIAGPGGALLQPVDAARGAGRALPGGRRHARDPVPRRHEPGRQGVRRRPRRPRRRAGAVGVRRRGRRAQAGLPGQPARHRRA